MKNTNKKKLTDILIEGVLGLLYIIGIGRYSSYAMLILSASYFFNIALPFGFYFLLKLNEGKIHLLKKWWEKSAIIILLALFSEIGRYFGLYVLGRTFDSIDIAIYAIGVLIAMFIDNIVLNNFRFWKIDPPVKGYFSTN